jgi:hypothetical protein
MSRDLMGMTNLPTILTSWSRPALIANVAAGGGRRLHGARTVFTARWWARSYAPVV